MNRFGIILLTLLLSVLTIACNGHKQDSLSNEEALQLLDAKIKKNNKNANLFYERGILEIEVGMDKNLSKYFKDAVSDLRKAIDLDNSRPEFYTTLADAQFRLGNVGESYSALQKALKIDADNFDANLKMGEIAFYSKDYDRAIESLNKVSSLDKNNQTALLMTGFIYKEMGDTANAVRYFRQLIELYPDYEVPYEELGMLYAQRGNKLGLEYLTTALRLEPTNTNVLYGLAMLYQDMEEADMATEYYVKILEIDPNNKYAWFNRGWIEMVLYEDYSNAADFFAKAIECDPGYAEAHHNLGLAYQLLGNDDEAQKSFNRAKALGFGNPAN